MLFHCISCLSELGCIISSHSAKVFKGIACRSRAWKKLFSFTLLMLFFFSTIVTAQEAKAKIFTVNLYQSDVDVSLEDWEERVFYINEVPPFTASYLLETTKMGMFKLFFKLSEEESWYTLPDEWGNPLDCPVNPGFIYCIIIGSDGSALYFELTYTADNNPKVCFLNGSDTALSGMEVGVDWGKDTVAYVENFDVMNVSNFVSVKPGNYSLFWQFPNQLRTGEHYFFPDDSGNAPKIFNFEEGRYYLFLAYTESRKDYAILYDITVEDALK
ncbi:MAG: hypothetical protein AB1798_01825 [Spirochaetota bacterium]